MKRKLITYAPLLLLLWSFLIPSQSYATHLAGADLTYAYVSSDGLGNHTYKVTFTWIRECSHGSVNLHPTETLRIKGCGGNTTVTMNRILVEDITPVCHPSYGCGQSNPFVIVYERHVYEQDITIAECDSWTFSVQRGDRNNAITTISSPQAFYIPATLNNVDFPTNSSPVFGNLPNTRLCVGEPYNFNHAVTDPNGNTLVFSIAPPMKSETTPVTYIGPRSPTSPYDGTYSVNAATGALSGVPATPSITVVAIKIVELDPFGEVIGSTVRDMQIQILPCDNLPPTTLPVSIIVCAGQTATYTVNATDPDMDEVFMDWGGEIDGASFTVVDNNSASPFPSGTFSWTPTLADVGFHFFTVLLQDTACPVNNVNVYTYMVKVDSCCIKEHEIGSCCEVELGNNSTPNQNDSSTVGDACDPCLTGGYPVWAKGPDGTPLDANDSDPCIIIEWLDESGTVIYTGWSFWASVDVHYTMRVTDVCENCSWEDDFFYECCGERNFDIQIIYGTQQRDPCDHPGAPFQIGIFDLDDGSLLTSPPYTITWTASDPSALTGLDTDEPTLWANVNVTYYVEIVDELGCVYRDTFEVDCCRAPQNLRCEQNSIGQPVLMWDPVPGVTTFEIFITINDPACCVNPPGLPMSAPIITVTGTSYVLTTNYPCASFRIRSVCGNHYSDFSASECIDCTRRNQGQTLLGGSSSIVDHYLNVFPSPAYDNITVAYEGIELGNILRITDQTGRVVLDEIVETEGTQKLDVSKLPAGVYVVTLMTKQGENPSSKVVILDK